MTADRVRRTGRGVGDSLNFVLGRLGIASVVVDRPCRCWFRLRRIVAPLVTFDADAGAVSACCGLGHGGILRA